MIATSEEVCRRRVFSFEKISSQRYLEISKKNFVPKMLRRHRPLFHQFLSKDCRRSTIRRGFERTFHRFHPQYASVNGSRAIQEKPRNSNPWPAYCRPGKIQGIKNRKRFFVRYSGLMGHHYERVIVPFDGTRKFFKSENLDFQPIGKGVIWLFRTFSACSSSC